MFKILVIDDDPVQLKIIEHILNDINSNMSFFKAANGIDALKIIDKNPPDLIITDWDMPQMDGIDFCKQVHKVKELDHIPVIMCTGVNTSSENLKTAFESGVSDFIRKPIDKMELTSRVNSMLKLSESYQTIKAQKEKIEEEKQKSDDLLLNILPQKVANVLKNKGYYEPELFDNVTVFYSDIVGFTELTLKIKPTDLIKELNDVISGFDIIMDKNHCERIKTVGDAYIAVCGMPTANNDHATNIINAALEVIEFLEERNKMHDNKWTIRVGIETGKVVGGIIGSNKYIYDIFGDPINMASRLESNSESMKIHISEKTYKLIKDQFVFEKRGAKLIKGKGKMKTYFVKSSK